MFTMDGDSVIAGGTNRGARVLDSRTSETIQVLPHDGMSHSISVRSYSHLCTGDIVQAVVCIFPYLTSVVSPDNCPCF